MVAARGLFNQAIADRLILSIKTVQNRVSDLLDKTGTGSRAELVAHARDAGVGAPGKSGHSGRTPWMTAAGAPRGLIHGGEAMNVLKLANPFHAAREVAGIAGAAAGTVSGAAGVVVSRSVGVGRAILPGTSTEGTLSPEHRAQQAEPQQPEPELPGADLAQFEPLPPAEPPIDVVGAALSADQGRPVTEGGAFVETLEPDPT